MLSIHYDFNDYQIQSLSSRQSFCKSSLISGWDVIWWVHLCLSKTEWSGCFDWGVEEGVSTCFPELCNWYRPHPLAPVCKHWFNADTSLILHNKYFDLNYWTLCMLFFHFHISHCTLSNTDIGIHTSTKGQFLESPIFVLLSHASNKLPLGNLKGDIFIFVQRFRELVQQRLRYPDFKYVVMESLMKTLDTTIPIMQHKQLSIYMLQMEDSVYILGVKPKSTWMVNV